MVVGVQRDKKVAVHALGKADPITQTEKDVLVPGQNHPVAPSGLEVPLQFAGVGKCYILFIDPGKAARPRIDTAVARVDDDGRTLVGLGFGRGANALAVGSNGGSETIGAARAARNLARLTGTMSTTRR